MAVRCNENKTEAFITVGKIIDYTYNSYGNNYATAIVRYGDDKAQNVKFNVSSSKTTYFFQKPIDSVKKMLSYDKLVFQYSTYSSGTYTVVFDIKDLEDNLKSLRKSCGW
jgi:hypothetical protein